MPRATETPLAYPVVVVPLAGKPKISLFFGSKSEREARAEGRSGSRTRGSTFTKTVAEIRARRLDLQSIF